ncbi:glycosyltransferase family 2 protein [Pseudomonadota bacterium]
MPKVSVIVPNYNHANFLALRLESILKQTFEDFELIFLDDGSTDDSLEVFSQFANDSRIISVFSQDNSGNPFIQWNKGIDLARGEFVWIAESDDFSDTEFLQAMVEKLEGNPEVGLACCQSWVVSDQGEKLYKIEGFPELGNSTRWLGDYLNSGRDEILRFLALQNTIPNASAVLFRKSLLAGDLRAPEHLKLCGDWWFWIRVLAMSDIAFLAAPLNYFRQAHSASQRGSISTLGTEVTEALEIQGLVLSQVNPDRKSKRHMLKHHLRNWVSKAIHFGMKRQWNGQVLNGFLNIYRLNVTCGLYERVLIYMYYLLVIPIKQNRLYRKFIAPGELRRFERKQ